MTRRLRMLIAAVSLAFLGVHLRALPQTLEDIDSVNFALGVEKFDVASHRPHPPGYPVFIALAKGSTHALAAVAPGWDRDRRAAVGLAIWGVVAGALAAVVLTEFWVAAGLTPWFAFLAAVLTLTSPLFWLTASRPLTDTPGLIAGVAVQALLLRGLNALRRGDAALSADLFWGALAAGFIIGLRSQTLWLTAPFLCWAIVDLGLARRFVDAVKLVAAAAAGALAWAVPLVWMSGGVARYLQAVRNQGAADLSGVEMLWTSPTWRLFSVAMRETFIDPWQLPTLAHVALGLAVIGAGVLAWRRSRLLVTIALGFVPYLLFHLAFQETVTIRYGLPLLVPVAGLAVVALSTIGARTAIAFTLALTFTSLSLAQPRLMAYADSGAPVFRAFQDMQRARPALPEPPVLKMHHQVWWGIRRAVEWYRRVWDVGPQPFPGDREWLSVVQHFQSGNTAPVWFLAHLSRTDLAVFDPRTTTLSGRYEFSPELRTLIGGTSRLDSLSWWSIRPPGWMLGAGWSLTPELAGMTIQDRGGPHVRPVDAFLTRRPGPARVLIGGRYLGPENGPAATVSATLDGRPVAEWQAIGSQRWFVQWIELPDGIPQGQGAHATLSVTARATLPGSTVPPVGLEQFDAAPVDEVIYALVSGWNELEEDPATGRVWRWTSAASTIEVRGANHDRTLEIAGESPLRYFDRAPEVTVRVGDRVVGVFSPAADFSQTVTLPADALKASSGVVTIATSRTFKPSDKGSADHRSLGLRLSSVSVK